MIHLGDGSCANLGACQRVVMIEATMPMIMVSSGSQRATMITSRWCRARSAVPAVPAGSHG